MIPWVAQILNEARVSKQQLNLHHGYGQPSEAKTDHNIVLVLGINKGLQMSLDENGIRLSTKLMRPHTFAPAHTLSINGGA